MGRILSETPKNDVVVSPALENLKAAKLRLAVNLAVSARMNACNRESEATPLARALRSPWQPPQFIPIRFIFTNKLSRDGKLLLAFDSSVLSEAMGREIGFTKNRPRRRSQHNKSKDIALSRVVRKRMERIAVLLCKLAPPDLGCEAEFGGSEKLWPPG